MRHREVPPHSRRAFPQVQVVHAVLPARTGDGRRGLGACWTCSLDRCYGSMPSPNLGCQVTGTLLSLAGLTSKCQCLIRPGVRESSAKHGYGYGYAGTDERRFTWPSIEPVLQILSSHPHSGAVVNCKSPSSCRPRSIKPRCQDTTGARFNME
jgi:hypothetical protein